MAVQLFPFTNLKMVFFNIQKIISDKNKSKGLAKRTNLSNVRFEKVIRPKPLEMDICTYIYCFFRLSCAKYETFNILAK